jgi:hypothetical protein
MSTQEDRMSEDTFGRRSILRTAGLTVGGAALGGATIAAPASAHDKHHDKDDDDRDHDKDISGSWRVDVHNDDGAESVSVLSFAAGDVCIVHDISPAGPPFTGTWRGGRHDSFRATVLTGFPGDGPDAPGPVVTLVLEGSVRHHWMSGRFSFTVMSAAGEELDAGTGTFDGRRIEA